MKQCPRCNRNYTDETLLYCLDDGSVLSVVYDPEATKVMASPQASNVPPLPVSPGYPPPPQRLQRRSNWPVYVLIVLLLLVVSGGAITLLIYGYSRLQDSSSAANLNTQGPRSQDSPSSRDTPQSRPAAGPTPQARQLVGAWRANVYEDKHSIEITYTFHEDGTSKAVFKTGDGQTQTHQGGWRYSDGTLFETFSGGASGKCTIKWIDNDNYELTIIDNGVPLYSGLKRRYRRISDSATD